MTTQEEALSEWRNTIEGHDAITLRIRDMSAASGFVDAIFADLEVLGSIRKIDIRTRQPDEDEEEEGDAQTESSTASDGVDNYDDYDTSSASSTLQGSGSGSEQNLTTEGRPQPSKRRSWDQRRRAKELRMRLKDEEMLNVCTPLILLLSAISATGGSLQSFTWTSENDVWAGYQGTRPRTFWQALWRHSRTLQSLSLGFFERELNTVPAPDNEAWEELRDLSIDAVTAHGDEATALDVLLRNCPCLETLRFAWPGCDLEGCQIRDISWDYAFPALHTLSVRGSDFAPEAFMQLLARCTNIETFVDGEDADSAIGSAIDPARKLHRDTLPKLQSLTIACRETTRPLLDWLDPGAARPIQHLSISTSFGAEDTLTALAKVDETAKSRIQVFEVGSDEWLWRPREVDSDDDEATAAQIAAEEGLSATARALKEVLPSLPGLRELRVGMESGSVVQQDVVTREWGHPPAMAESGLRLVLSLLPSTARLGVLRMTDSRGGVLAEELLGAFPSVPLGLEVLRWEGEVAVNYRLERYEGRVRAVVCEEREEGG